MQMLSMANCYFATPHGMHCYIPFSMLLISNAPLVLARHRCFEGMGLFVVSTSPFSASLF
jgi:hypothetical protein